MFLLRYYYDGWSIIESVYFLWICLTTVGFGDYIINDGKPYYEGDLTKTVMLRLNIIILIIGLCQVSCILVSIQNALETNLVQKVNQEEGNNEDSGDTNDCERNETRNIDDIGKSNEACEMELEMPVHGSKHSDNISAISMNTL